MKERIEIENFGCIDIFNLDINKINIIIGPQAAGKSLTAKLLYYFKSIFSDVRRIGDFDMDFMGFERYLKNKFITYFPETSWGSRDFSVRYYFGNILIELKCSAELQIICSPDFKRIFDFYKNTYNRSVKRIESDDSIHFESNGLNVFRQFIAGIQGDYGMPIGFKQIFVPAGRSFFASIKSSVFTMLSENSDLDPFLVEFGSYYEMTKRVYRNMKYSSKKLNIIHELMTGILHGNYEYLHGEDYLVHDDYRTIKLDRKSVV